MWKNRNRKTKNTSKFVRRQRRLLNEDDVWWIFWEMQQKQCLNERKDNREGHSNFTCQKPNLLREENEELWKQSKVEIKEE